MALFRIPSSGGGDMFGWNSNPWAMVPPVRIFDQLFGGGMLDEDLRELRELERLQRQMIRRMNPTLSSAESGMSEVTNDDSKFQVNLDVSQFSPEEIKVKTAENCITVEGKHEEHQDEHGFIARHFARRYVLPKGVNAEALKSKLSSSGVLTIEAPKLALNAPPERQIPIEHCKDEEKTKGENAVAENAMNSH